MSFLKRNSKWINNHNESLLKIIVRIVAALTVFLLFIAGVIFWFEAEKEVQVLCSLFVEGKPVAEVVSILETGNLLAYSQGPRLIYVESIITLGSSSCSVMVSEASTVIEATYRQSFHLEKIAGWIGVVGSILLTMFLLLLAGGFPLGEYAWGGTHRRLPTVQRIGSGCSALLLIVAIASILTAIGYTSLLPAEFAAYYVLFVTLIFLFIMVGSSVSKSTKERKIMIPASIVLFGCYFIVLTSVL
jgi:flagellar basal body-associated protein FliL